jgi:hypothetical protein
MEFIVKGGYDVEVFVVEADDYEIDEDGDLVFWGDEGEDELVEIGRCVGFRGSVFRAAEAWEVELEAEDEGEAEDGE